MLQRCPACIPLYLLCDPRCSRRAVAEPIARHVVGVEVFDPLAPVLLTESRTVTVVFPEPFGPAMTRRTGFTPPSCGRPCVRPGPSSPARASPRSPPAASRTPPRTSLSPRKRALRQPDELFVGRLEGRVRQVDRASHGSSIDVRPLSGQRPHTTATPADWPEVRVEREKGFEPSTSTLAKGQEPFRSLPTARFLEKTHTGRYPSVPLVTPKWGGKWRIW
jgi:hypothetical protein